MNNTGNWPAPHYRSSLLACSRHLRGNGETLAVFTKNQTNPFFQTVRIGPMSWQSAEREDAHYIPTKPTASLEQLTRAR